jgi:hypothetical protein
MDTKKGEYKNKHDEWLISDTHNTFRMISKVWGRAGSDIYYHHHYQLDIPKNIKLYTTVNHHLYVMYDSKQVIVVESGYKNRGENTTEWTLIDVSKNNEAERHIFDAYRYLTQKEYSEKYLEKLSKNRISKIYTNKKSSIYLYNIKKENFEEFLKFAKTFKYIEVE